MTLKTLSEQWNEWLHGLSARERLLLSVAASLTALLLLWFAAVSPVLTARARAEREYRAALDLYTEVTAGAREAARLRMAAPAEQPEGAGGEPLRAAAGALARDFGLEISRIQPGEAGALAFVFEIADPTDLFRWVEALETRYGAGAATATMSRNQDGRTVQANILVTEAR